MVFMGQRKEGCGMKFLMKTEKCSISRDNILFYFEIC